PALFPKLPLLTHQLIDPTHIDCAGTIEQWKEKIDQFLLTRGFRMPTCCRARGITKPHDLWMNASIRPTGHQRSHQICVLPCGSVFDSVENLAYVSRPLKDCFVRTTRSAGNVLSGREHVVVREQEFLPANGRSEDHLANTMRFKGAIELRPVNLAIHHVV